MKFYRFEDSTGCGIFRSRHSRSYTHDEDDMPHRFTFNVRPPFEDEPIRKVFYRNDGEGLSDTSYLFGFSSEEQIKNAFTKDEMILLTRFHGEKEITIAVYEVEPQNMVVGETQAIAKREHMQLSNLHTAAEFLSSLM